MAQFIGYHIAADRNDSVPIATGETHADCYRKVITRALINPAFHHGYIDVQERNEITAEEFKEFGDAIDRIFAEANTL